MRLCGHLLLCLFALASHYEWVGGLEIGGYDNEMAVMEGVGATKAPTTGATAWLSFSTHDLELVSSQHQNSTIFLVLRGTLADCININFTYSPSNPSIVPLEELQICPPPELSTSISISALTSESTTTAFTTRKSTTQTHTSPVQSTSDTTTTTSTALDKTTYDSTLLTNTSLFYNTSATSTATLRSPEVSDHQILHHHPRATSASAAPLVWNGSMEMQSRWVGKTIVGVVTNNTRVDVVDAFVRVSVIYDPALDTVSNVFGWIYTIIWNISFLPQFYLNWRRKSVEGLSLDNITLNIVAYFYYSLFNIAFFAIPFIKSQFEERYTWRVNHVRTNDVVFSIYSFLIDCAIGIQCLIYHRAVGQVVSKPCRVVAVASVGAVVVACVLAGVDVIWWLDVFYVMSYLKLIITPMKYIPQVYVNYKRKSTEGFSVLGVVLDNIGGIMSLAQMFMLSANNNDWLSIFTDFSKFGLGVITIFFDFTFFAQHYHYQLRGTLCKKQNTDKVDPEPEVLNNSSPDLEYK